MFYLFLGVEVPVVALSYISIIILSTCLRYNPSCVTYTGRGRHHVRDAGWQDVREGRCEHFRCHGQPAAPGRPADEV